MPMYELIELHCNLYTVHSTQSTFPCRFDDERLAKQIAEIQEYIDIRVHSCYGIISIVAAFASFTAG